MRAALLALIAVLSLAACDTSGPEITPEGLEGTWERVGEPETFTFRSTGNGYRFERTRGGEVVTVGSFATIYNPNDPSDEFSISYTVSASQSTEVELPNDTAQLSGDGLTLTAEVADAETRTYTRAD